MKSTFGERVKRARTEAGLSQKELAARIAHITRTRPTKSLISRWELGKVGSPQGIAVDALSAVTGFSSRWLVTGKGPERGAPEETGAGGIYGRGLTRDILRMGILVASAEKTGPDPIADAAIEVIEALMDDPGLPKTVLHRIARLATTRTG